MKINRPIPSSHVKLLIFDLDGTLVDSRRDLSMAVNAMLRHFGRPELPCDLIASYIGDGAPLLVRRALGDPDDESYFTGAVRYFQSWYGEHLLDNTLLYDGIQEALDLMRAGNGGERKMAVLSNKPVNPSRRIVDGLGLSRYFFQVYGGNSFHTKKPDPFGVLNLCEQAGVRPEEAVMIGDSSNDILAGRNGGMWTLGVTYGLAPQTLEVTPPDVLVDSPEEMARIFRPEAETVVSSEVQNGEVTPPSPS